MNLRILVIPVAVGAILAVMLSVYFISANSDSNGFVGIGAPPSDKPMPDRSAPPEPYEIMIDGKSEGILIKIGRGETLEVPVAINPKVSDISGDVRVYSTQPGCTGPMADDLPCDEGGIQTRLSTERLSASENHITLFITASEDAKVGIHSYQMEASTMMQVDYQENPVLTGNLVTFGVEVVQE